MIENQLVTIHGYTLKQIEKLLVDSCDILDRDVSLDSRSIGGWSNINLRGTSRGQEFVLKMPWSLKFDESNPYEPLSRLLVFLAKSDITAPPLAIGRFHDIKSVPFMILQYIDGIVHPSISKANPRELEHLKDVLDRLSRQKQSSLPRYRTPGAYLDRTHMNVTRLEEIFSISKDVEHLINEFNRQYTKISPIIDALGAWSQRTMHGDLWAPNIIFRKERALLVDFEMCCIGDSLYDLAYLMEASDNAQNDALSRFLTSKSFHCINEFRPVALMFLIGWSLERLIHMDAGLVEPNLTSPKIREDMMRYCNQKFSRLDALGH